MNSIETTAGYSVQTSAQNGMRTAQLVGKVYETISAQEQSKLLGQLLRPLGILSLVGVADGIFAKLWFRSGQQIAHIRLDDAHQVQAGDVADLVEFVQQVSVETVNAVVAMLAKSPALAGSTAAALLAATLIRRIRYRRARRSGPQSQLPLPARVRDKMRK
jgi:hypothetical protein